MMTTGTPEVTLADEDLFGALEPFAFTGSGDAGALLSEALPIIAAFRIATTADLQARLEAAEGRIAELEEGLEQIAALIPKSTPNYSHEVWVLATAALLATRP